MPFGLAVGRTAAAGLEILPAGLGKPLLAGHPSLLTKLLLLTGHSSLLSIRLLTGLLTELARLSWSLRGCLLSIGLLLAWGG